MRPIGTSLLLLAAACSPAPATVASAPAPSPAAAAQPVALAEDARAALATVQRLLDAMKTRDTATMRRIFDPAARLYAQRMRRDSTVFIQAITGSDFINAVASNAAGPEWNERIFSPEVRVSGPLATVWAEYDFHAGAKFSHCGVDAVQLLKVGTAWKIVALTDTRVVTGCPTRPAP